MDAKQQYINDFKTIHEAIDGNRNDMKPFQNIFLVYGIVNLLLSLSEFIVNVMIRSHAIWASRIMMHSDVAGVLIMAVVIIMSCRKIKENTNKYYRMVMLIYAVFMIAIPLVFQIVFIARGFGITIASTFEAQNYISMTLSQLQAFAGIFLSMFSLLLVGYTKEKKILIIFAVIHILVYLLLYVSAAGMTYKYVSINYSGIYYMLTQIFVYIILGLYVKKSA